MEKLSSNWRNKIPFKIIKELNNNEFIDENNNKYKLFILSKEEYLIYYDISKLKGIRKPIYEFLDNNMYYIIYKRNINNSEINSILSKIIDLYLYFFDEYSYSLNLKKDYFINLKNIFKVLDNKFIELEMHIRSLELSAKKDDLAWLILSKYYNILDAKTYLYDIQSELFKMIDNNELIKLGIVFRHINYNTYKNGSIEPNFNMYYAPKSMIFLRIYMDLEHKDYIDILLNYLDKLDRLDRLYFLFMGLYIYILNLRLDNFLNYANAKQYVDICNKINLFIKKFGRLIK